MTFFSGSRLAVASDSVPASAEGLVDEPAGQLALLGAIAFGPPLDLDRGQDQRRRRGLAGLDGGHLGRGRGLRAGRRDQAAAGDGGHEGDAAAQRAERTEQVRRAALHHEVGLS
jgi:hypothetical protein